LRWGFLDSSAATFAGWRRKLNEKVREGKSLAWKKLFSAIFLLIKYKFPNPLTVNDLLLTLCDVDVDIRNPHHVHTYTISL
jgi:hypothetical protein